MKEKNKQTASLIPSPCISVCAMNENTGYCRGCMRSIDEITKWERYTEEEKRTVTEALKLRHETKHNDLHT